MIGNLNINYIKNVQLNLIKMNFQCLLKNLKKIINYNLLIMI